LFFSSPIGLGHITRDVAIMDRLVKLYNYKNIGFVTGSVAFEYVTKLIDYSPPDKMFVLNLYDPPGFSIKDGKLSNGFLWLLRYLYYYANCKRKLRDFFCSPEYPGHLGDLIISDEDFAVLSYVKKNIAKRVLITDVLQTKFGKTFLTSKFEKTLNNSMCTLIKSCESVIIPEFGDDLDNFFYVGPIVREIGDTRDELREKLSFNKKTILVSTGGTGAGLYLLKKTIESFSQLKNNHEYELVILSSYDAILPKLSQNCRYVGFVNNGHEYVKASDLVISLAGKSTIDESLVYGTPGIFIPIKNHFEQEHRAKLLGFKYDDVFKLVGLIEEKLSTIDRIETKKVENGVLSAAKILHKILNY
jgi:UDP-N-acetylglucosamine--N-acetylmuramyl-(pentapeptide) pyrophosphoryl-undecaprenol N-acetylglucosamine transferase